MDLERIKQNFRIRSGRAKKGQRTRKTPTRSEPKAESNSEQGIQLRQDETRRHSEQAVDEDSQGTKVDDSVADQVTIKNQTQTDLAGNGVEENVDDVNEQQLIAVSEESDLDLKPERKKSDQMSASESEDFDFRPPEPRPRPPSLEDLSVLLFSSHHLDSLLHDPPHLANFSGFLQRYLPDYHPLLSQYLETQKAIRAIEYANAIAEGLKPKDTGGDTSTEIRKTCCTLDPEFERISTASFDALVGDALPKYISYLLVKVSSECLVNEITGRYTSGMQDMVGGLSEVFCLTDPKQPDNPIIFASEEFYRLTRYGPEDTLNSNCRFLQGRKTQQESVQRIRDAIKKGEEICETLLNYRRDGKPFINLLMIAPLHDKNGKLKYFLGAQLDATGLLQGGKALDGFQRFLTRRILQQRLEDRRTQRHNDPESQRKNRALAKLRDLSEMFDLEESAVVANSRSNSLTRDEDDVRSIGSIERRQRRVFADGGTSEDDSDLDDQPEQRDAFELGQAGDGRLSGKLPGVYESFMLLRPAPSLRIVFVSPRLQKIGNVLQTPFLSHVAAPNATLTGLAQSLRAGVPVSAKIHFSPERGQDRDGTTLKNGTKHEDGKHGRAIWVSMTPLVGDDERVGVWMCVVVEKSKVGPISKVHPTQEDAQITKPIHPIEDRPIRPIRVNSQTKILKHDHESYQARSKAIRQKESVYFDAEGGQALANEMNHDSNASQTAPKTEHPIVTDALPQTVHAVATPVEEYDTQNDFKPYSVPIPGVSQNFSSGADEHINSKPPPSYPQTNNGRVIIKDDDSILDQPEDTSSRGRSRSARSASPVWSPLNETTLSIPSSAHLADDEDDEEIPVEDFQPGDDSSDQHSNASSRPSRRHAQSDRAHDHEDNSPDTLREVSRDRGVSKEVDRDSAIGMNSPAETRHKFDRQESYHSQSQRSTKSHASHTSGLAPVLEPITHVSHAEDIENWVTEGRPVSSHQNTGMDYLKAGNFTRTMAPRLTKEAIEDANATPERDLSSLDDWCAASPYSVD